ncbi:unnamed protein product [Orchesella dallaii]|uniref:F-box domain-containing protein n=1 Tax=Orchesella dallaii TaxID=48710 RepID=A0ABP1S7D5_9HEXA
MRKTINHPSRRVQDIMLPEEIWDIIFRDMTANDFHSATLACPAWDRLLCHKKGRILFPLVLPILVDYLPIQTLLNCRLVNKTSKKLIDNILQNCYQTDAIIDPKRNKRMGSRITSIINKECYSFYTPQKILRFITHFETFSFNPFLTGSVSLSGCVPENVEGWEMNILSFLAHFGHHIKSLDLHTNFENGAHFLYAVKQISFLNYVPNLKVLKLSGVVWRKVEVKHLMRLGRLPDLKKLVHLDVETSSWVVLQLLLRQCGPQLSKFHLRRMFPMSPEINWKKITALVPNVKEFQLIYDNEVVARSFPKIIGECNWNLERLVIASQTLINITDIIAAVNQFSTTLVELEISAALSLEQVSNCYATYFEKMEVFFKLKILKIKLFTGSCNGLLNVLLVKTPNLVELYLLMEKPVNIGDATEMFQNEVCLLPKLKKITIQVERHGEMPLKNKESDTIVVTRIV